MEIVNKKAYFNYFIDSELEAGIVLKGTEIKSVRKGSVNLTDSYVRIKNNEAYIINMFIDKYDEGNIFNHDPTRERKLLLHKKEIKRLLELTSRDGYTLVPVKLYIKNDKAKISIGIAKGKKLYDKRETIKKRDLERDNRLRR
ncbi:SsrA-binding protein SmpB [bacterium]|jgi:SsrA-binding protein|nr:SsrA-binding protein SmpB [bacterium]